MSLSHLDLFSGIGGFALAARWAGFQTVAFSEIDPYAIRVLRKHWPDVPNLGDIRTADFSTVGPVDLLTGGFPCQPWSQAGKQLGSRDHRDLWPAMRDTIKALRPTWIVGENVARIIVLGGLDRCCSDLENIGYSAQPIVIPACAVGAPHERERVWIIAHADSQRLKKWSECDMLSQRKEGWNWAASCRSNSGRLGENAPDAESDRRRENVESVTSQKGSRPASGLVTRDDQTGVRQWSREPGIQRVADGLPNRVDRLRGIGNAIVPQVAFEILRHIAALEANVFKA